MGILILDATTRAAVQAATSQQLQLEELIAPWLGGNVTARILNGDTLLRTLTLGPFEIDTGASPRKVTCGAVVSDVAVAEATPTKVVFRSGATDIFSVDAGAGAGTISFVGPIKDLCAPDLDAVAIEADPDLPALGFAAPGNVRIAIWGQSNAIGRALRSDIAASPLSSDPTLEDYDTGVMTFTRVKIWNGSSYVTLAPGVNTSASSDQFGVEFGLATRWMRETDSGTLYLEKVASSGVSITIFDPPSGFNWALGTAERGQADTWLSGQGVTLDADHWVWIQGESDAAQTQAWYETRLQEIIDELYADGLLTAPTSRIVLSQMHPSTSTYGAGVAAAKSAIATASSGEISAIGYPFYMKISDTIHYNGRGQVQHAYDVFEFLFDAPAKAT